MRKSHREKEANSCEWKQFFYHLCCGVDKMYNVFHRDNLNQPKIKYLYHGCSVSEINRNNELPLQTVTSFSSKIRKAEAFATSQGMLLVVDNVFESLCNRRLRGASTWWINPRPEAEYIILPTTFKYIKPIKDKMVKENIYKIPRFVNQNIKVYATNIYQSTDLNFITRDIYNDIDSPLSWFSLEDPKWRKQIEDIINTMSAVFMIVFGGFLTWSVPCCI